MYVCMYAFINVLFAFAFCIS